MSKSTSRKFKIMRSFIEEIVALNPEIHRAPFTADPTEQGDDTINAEFINDLRASARSVLEQTK